MTTFLYRQCHNEDPSKKCVTKSGKIVALYSRAPALFCVFLFCFRGWARFCRDRQRLQTRARSGNKPLTNAMKSCQKQIETMQDKSLSASKQIDRLAACMEETILPRRCQKRSMKFNCQAPAFAQTWGTHVSVKNDCRNADINVPKLTVATRKI